MSRPHEQPLPDPSEPNEHDAWLEAELLGVKTQGDREDAERSIRETEAKIRRQEMLERIFAFSDLLVHAPQDFPDKRYFEHLASAAAQMLQIDVRPRAFAIESVIDELSSALEILTREREERGGGMDDV